MTLRVCFSYHRSGSSWLTRLLQQACDELGLRFGVLHDASTVDDLGAWARGLHVLNWTNADGRRLAELGSLRGVHVVRDPRDVVVSAYFSHLLSHPTDGMDWLPPHRAELASLSRHDGLLAEVRCRSLQFEQMLAWPGHDQVEEVRFESLVSDPASEVPRLLRALDLVGRARLLQRRLTDADAARIAADHAFHRLAGGRSAGTEDPGHHYRRGTPGDWRDHLGPDHLDLLEATWPELIPRYGAGR